MRPHRSVTPPTGRITLVVLAIVAAALGFPWHSARERWVLGIAIVVVITLLVRWRGYPVTTILRRRLAMRRSDRSARLADRSATDVRTTALLRVMPPESRPDVLPLPLIASYADRYGLRADAILASNTSSLTLESLAPALQDPGREAWHGRNENLSAGQQALYHRASCNGAATVGKYTDEMEAASSGVDDPPHRRDWRDD